MKTSEYKLRRQKVLAQIGAGNVGILFAARRYPRSDTDQFPFRQDSDFYYLSGFNETDAVIVLLPGRSAGEVVMFSRAPDPTQELWNGKISGQEAVCAQYGADQSFPIAELDSVMPLLLQNVKRVFFKIGRDPERDAQVIKWVGELQAKVREGIQAPFEFVNLEKILHAMRLCKSADEIALIRKAASITANAHGRAMQHCAPGMYEYEIEAVMMEEFTKNGGRYQAFESIVGGGKNACTIHYSANNELLEDGSLLLLDAGVEFEHYAADITRTFPVNGRFTNEQRLIYRAVLNTQLAVIELIKPGVEWNQLQTTAERVITEHLCEYQLLHGSVNELLEAKAFKPFFMHRIGHWLGLDCHDVGEYRSGDKWQVLQSGMIFTVEPGIYISSQMSNVDAKWHNIGVRIEDDILVTASGCEVLTAAAPKNISEIEMLMNKK
jgi:Xaa-Pro aminopeptidase